jgi:hypothetical protein
MGEGITVSNNTKTVYTIHNIFHGCDRDYFESYTNYSISYISIYILFFLNGESKESLEIFRIISYYIYIYMGNFTKNGTNSFFRKFETTLRKFDVITNCCLQFIKKYAIFSFSWL